MAGNIYKPENSKYWYLRIQIEGKAYRESLQTTSRRAAEKLARVRIAELKEMNQRGDRDWLFSSGFVRFLNELESGKSTWSPKTIKRYKTSLLQVGRILDEWCSDIGGDVEELLATDITTAVVAEFVSRRLEEGVDVQTINRDLTPFRHLMNSMKNHGWIEVNPIVAYERQGMKETLPDIVLPTDAAIRKLGARAPGTLAHFPAFLNETGMRVTEAAMLLRSDVRGLEDYPRSKVTVTLRATKGKKVRVITLRAAAVRILSQIEPSAMSPYVFWNNTEHGHYRDAASLFWQYREETKFGARLHDLRHKFAIERLREGWSIYRVQRYLGHVSVTTTERYYLRYLTSEEQERVRADGDNGL